MIVYSLALRAEGSPKKVTGIKIYDLIGNGDIDEFIDEEEIPPSHENGEDEDELSSNEYTSDSEDEGDKNEIDESKLPVSLRNLKLGN